MRAIAAVWKQLNPEEKIKWERDAAKAKEIYGREMEEYMRTQGDVKSPHEDSEAVEK